MECPHSCQVCCPHMYVSVVALFVWLVLLAWCGLLVSGLVLCFWLFLLVSGFLALGFLASWLLAWLGFLVCLALFALLVCLV